MSTGQDLDEAVDTADGKVLVVGGVSGVGHGTKVLASAEIYGS